MTSLTRQMLGPALAAVLLLGMLGTTSLLRLTPADAEEYHAAVRKAVDDLPWIIGDWIAHETPVPTQATNLLKPNAVLSREYVNTRSGARVSVLLIHCLDARDLHGHYPLECYPAAGWNMLHRGTERLDTSHGTISVARYHFDRPGVARQNDRLAVMNLMVLPDGKFDTAMAGVGRIAGDYRLRHLGAGELQLLVDPDLPPDEQAAIWTLFFDALSPALRVIQSGAQTLE